MGFRTRIAKIMNRSRRAISGAGIAVTMVAVSIALYIGVNILPGALAGWYAATQSGGSLENMSVDFKNLWNLTPIIVLLVIVVSFVAIALYELKNVDK